MAANMSAVMTDTDKVQQFHADAIANGLTVLPPDVNAGEYRFVPVDAKTVRYGLGGIKGTGESAIGTIVKARSEHGPFADLFDLCERVDKRLVNRRVVEALVRSGAFDSIDARRARLLAAVGIAIEAAEQRERDAQQVSLFGDAAARTRPAMPEVPPWDEQQRLAEEKAALGFYLSGHPFGVFAREFAPFIRTRLADVVPRNEPQLLAGMVASARTAITRRGKMSIVLLDDGTAQLEVSVYNELWETSRDLVREDRPLVVQGRVSKDEFSGGFRVVAERIFDLGGARARFARGLRLSVNGEASTAASLAAKKLRELLGPYRNGPCPVSVRYRNGDAVAELRLGDDWRVKPEDGLIASLNDWLKPENVEIVYS
jgi:DNA polymerase-3 subunit alpha